MSRSSTKTRMVTDHINGIRGTSISITSNSSQDTTSNNNSSSTEVTISSISSKVIISSSKAITRAATSTTSSKDPMGNNSMGRTEVMANSSTAGNSKEGISHREGMEETAIIVVVRIREINTTADNKGSSRGSNTAAARGVTSGLTLSHMEPLTRSACVRTKGTSLKNASCKK